jgi:small-conductance mechanosensitive channel
MEPILIAFTEIFSGIPWRAVILGLAVLLLGQFIVRLFQMLLMKIGDRFPAQKKNYGFHKVAIYGLNILVLLLFLKVIHVDIKYILGAASVLTLAIGFAARTSISNLISGFFLIFEKPFYVGDLIEINDVKGEVLSLDLLCVRLRTLDNLMVRIPNEVVVGAAVRNHTYFPIRRFDLKLVFSHKESLTNIHKLLVKVAEGNELALNEPEPFFEVVDFKESYIEVAFKVWASRENYFEFKSNFPKAVHRAIKNSGIDQPYKSIEILDNKSSSEERA